MFTLWAISYVMQQHGFHLMIFKNLSMQSPFRLEEQNLC